MLKKLVLSTLGVGAVAGVTLGSDAFSYLSTAYDKATASVREAVPMDFQIDRARKMVQDLAPEVRSAMEVIAREEIEVERLGEQITAAQGRAEAGKRDILRLQSDLETGAPRFTYAGHHYSRAEVTEDLSRRFVRHKVGDETLAHLEEMHKARQGNLDAARQKLAAMVSAQKNLETELVNLEAKRSLVAVAQASTDVQLDDSQLAKTKKLLADIRSQLDVASKLAHADVTVPGEIVLDGPESKELSAQVADYFGLQGDLSSEPKPAVAAEAPAKHGARPSVAMRD
ncbi:MAG: hypothetical protein ACRCT8_07125 [Lacipirellulaceae bacterium]